ncbi:sensor histidine kinase [Chachezhania antarctica]|uniref:sensor histidine kinase n=1 Tax=Chachezhania antarctica TaxID=2340860 RepID=UPI0013CE4DC7|nr:HAMP domain-containing sensor histidine kinase [Chachezhania antarctica]
MAVALIAILAALAFLSPLLLHTLWFKLTVLVVICLGTTAQVVLAVAALRRGQSGSVFLVLGFGALAISITFGALGYMTEGLFEQELAGRAIRLGFLFEAAFFSAAIARRVRAARRERDASLREQLRLSEDRLNLSEALRKAEDDRQRAANAAARSQEALASTVHDIRQPLASLQMALAGGGAVPDRITRSLDYLEDIVRAGLEGYSLPLGTGDADSTAENARERFRAGVVLKNIDAMFAADAVRQGVRLTVVDSSAHLVADPLALMRIMGNLVSNALRRANAERIVVGCRRRPGALCFEVHDNGQGIPAAELDRLHQRGEKGAASDGHGLGMAIIADLARENGLSFDMVSTSGLGTIARVSVPLSRTEEPR